MDMLYNALFLPFLCNEMNVALGHLCTLLCEHGKIHVYFSYNRIPTKAHNYFELIRRFQIT